MADLKRIFSRIADRQDAADLDAQADRIARKLDRGSGPGRDAAAAEVRKLRAAAENLRKRR